MSRVDSDLRTLNALLDSAELAYRVAAEEPAIASFRHDVVGHGMCDVTAAVTGAALRFTVARVLRCDDARQLPWCFFVDREWAFGSLHSDATGAWLDASVSIYVGATPPSRNQVRHALTQLIDGVRMLREGELPRFEAGVVHIGHPDAYQVPGLDACVSLDAVRVALVACGLEPAAGRGDTLLVTLNHGGVALGVALYLFDDGALLNLQCEFIPARGFAAPAAAASQLHAINRTLPCGTTWPNERGSPIFHMGVPVALLGAGTVDAPLLRWALSTAVSTMTDRVLPLLSRA